MNKLLIFITFLVAALATTNAIHSTAKDNIILPGTGSNTIQKTRMAATGSNDGDANAKQVMDELTTQNKANKRDDVEQDLNQQQDRNQQQQDRHSVGIHRSTWNNAKLQLCTKQSERLAQLR